MTIDPKSLTEVNLGDLITKSFTGDSISHSGGNLPLAGFPSMPPTVNVPTQPPTATTDKPASNGGDTNKVG